ncbi:MAG TPA: translation initiation factor [Chthoniobacterales bacterium]
MRPAPKKRVETDPSQAPIGKLGDALNVAPLPELRASSAEPFQTPAAVNPGWKPGRVVIRRETAHRGGKTVTVVEDFATHLPISFILNLAKRLKAACGGGGTAKARRIEIQGDQISRVREFLAAEGFQVAGERPKR